MFFLWRNLSLLLILLMNFNAIDSLETFLSNEQPRYVTVLLCLMSIDPYLISRVPTWCSLFFCHIV